MTTLQSGGPLPPHNADAEAAVLGACVLDPGALDLVLDQLREDDFYRTAHQRTFRAINELHSAAQTVDLVTVQDWLASRGMLETVGGPIGLAGLTERVASASNVEAYVRLVLESSDARKLQALGQRMAQGAVSRAHELSAVLDESAEALHLIGNRADNGTEEDSLGQVTEDEQQAFDELISGKQRGFTYQPANLCATLGPIIPGRMVVLAGRPGEGKSALLLHLGLELAKGGVPVLMLSLEMNMTELRARSAAWHSGCDATALIEGPLTKEALDKAKLAWAALRKWPFRASYVPGLSIGRIRSRVRSSIRKHRTQVVLVDYLQLVQPNGNVETQEQRISQASEGLRLIAQTLGPAVVCAAQLNRSSEKGDRRPARISDLRGSGQIEQDAHVIGLIQSDDADNIAEPEPLVIVTCAKRRMGSTGRAEVKFLKRHSRFEQAVRDGGEN